MGMRVPEQGVRNGVLRARSAAIEELESRRRLTAGMLEVGHVGDVVRV
jgi:hypothetical protein